MFEESEVITLLIGVGAAILVAANVGSLSRVPRWRLLVNAFLFLLLGWVLTILEGFTLPSALHAAEHASYAASSILLFAWSLIVFVVRRGEG